MNRTLYDDTVTSQTLSYSGTSNRLTAIDSQSVTTDNNGNITSIHGMTLAYDAHNLLNSATVSSVTTNYAYNGIGERVTKTTGSNTRHYFYAGPNMVAEYDDTGSVEREYLYLQDQPVVMLDHTGLGTDIYWIHNDHLGRPLALTDESGDVVWRITSTDAFGHAAVIDEDPDNNSVDVTFNIRFPGQYFDTETSFHYNYYRDYDPRTGRYIESDPIGLDGGVNTYLYANANPILYTDPTGEAPVIVIMAGVGAFVGGIAGAIINWECDPIGGFARGAVFGAATGAMGAFGSGIGATSVTSMRALFTTTVTGPQTGRAAATAIAGSVTANAATGLDTAASATAGPGCGCD